MFIFELSSKPRWEWGESDTLLMAQTSQVICPWIPDPLRGTIQWPLSLVQKDPVAGPG